MGWLLALIAFASTSSIAFAQTQPQTTPQKVPANTVGTAAQPNFGQVLQSVNNPGSAIAKVQSMNGGSANNLRPVNVAALRGADANALSAAVTKNQGQLGALRGALSRVMVTTADNERISIAQFLADNRITLAQVVGADMNNGMLMLYYQK
jgi:hypothetical protein